MNRFFKLLPSFSVELPQRPTDVLDQIRQAIRTPEYQGFAESAGNCVDFKIDPKAQRFWSPHLSVQVSETETGSLVFARFSPRPEIWTMFMAIYAVVATVIFGSLVYAYVQWFMGHRPWALAIAPIGALTILGLHVGSLMGQSLSVDQMKELRVRLDAVLKTVDETVGESH